MHLVYFIFFSTFFFIFSIFGLSQERKGSYPFISGDTFRERADHILDETNFETLNLEVMAKEVQKNDIIFVKTDFLSLFFKKIHPHIQAPYVLITHNSDKPIPGRFASYLNSDKLIAWFGINIDTTPQNPREAFFSICLNKKNYVIRIPPLLFPITNRIIHLKEWKHPKLIIIPLGIANHYWPHGNKETFERAMKEKQLSSKKHLVYLNVDISSNPEKRKPVVDFFKDEAFVYATSKKPIKEYLQDLSFCEFVISPQGNGWDCHRTWEALMMGAIPIIPRSPIKDLYIDLPVIMIDSWTEVTSAFLQKSEANLKKKQCNSEKLYFDYWWNLIESYKR